MATSVRAALLAASLLLVAGQHESANAASRQMSLTASAGSHSVRVKLQDPCVTDPFDGLVESVTGAGAALPGAVAITASDGELLQAAAWSGQGSSAMPTTVGCDAGDRRFPAGMYVVTVLSRGPVHITTRLDGPAAVNVKARSRATLHSTELNGVAAATSSHEEQQFTTPEAAVAVFSESVYTTYVASAPKLCIRRTSSACSDGITLISPGLGGTSGASYAVQSFEGSGFATFEEQAAAVRTYRTDTTIVLPL